MQFCRVVQANVLICTAFMACIIVAVSMSLQKNTMLLWGVAPSSVWVEASSSQEDLRNKGAGAMSC